MRPSRPPAPNRQSQPPRERGGPRRGNVYRDPSVAGIRPTGETVEGTVAWFDADKGFGFVDLGGDRRAFLHATALEARRLRAPQQGARLRCQIGEGPKGLQVTEVLSMTEGEAPTPAAADQQSDRRPPRGERPAARPAPGVPMLGVVKRYDPEKGFGFVGIDEGGPDAFLHANVVKRTFTTPPVERQRVMILVAEGARGREVKAIAPID